MKRYFLNPGDMAIGIALIAVGVLFCVPLTVWLIVSLLTMSPSESDSIRSVVFMAAILFAILLSPIIGGVLYCHHYKGFLYVFDDRIAIKNGKNEVEIDISRIRWIDIKPYFRPGARATYSKEQELQFSIRLYDEKKDLDVRITNSILLDVIGWHQIRIMPNHYNEEYIRTGSFDFIRKPPNR